MSGMELFYGTIEKSSLDIEPYDDDDFYDLERSHGGHYAKVDGQLYFFKRVTELDEYGYSVVIDTTLKNPFMCYWYNGGAGLREVVENMIKYNKDKIL